MAIKKVLSQKHAVDKVGTKRNETHINGVVVPIKDDRDAKLRTNFEQIIDVVANLRER